MPPEPSDFLSVAEMLVQNSTSDLSDSADLWVDCEDARARSAISRGYYAAFRVLKARLMTRRAEWRSSPSTFPSRSIHEKIRLALEQHLTAQNDLVRDMRALLRLRNDADYAFSPIVNCDDAESDLETCEAVVDAINALSDDELDGIALELKQIDSSSRST